MRTRRALGAKGFKWPLLSLVFSVITEWEGAAFWWPDLELDHGQNLAVVVVFTTIRFDRVRLVSQREVQPTATQGTRLADVGRLRLCDAVAQQLRKPEHSKVRDSTQ